METALSAPLEIEFDYTRSLGPILGPFMTALRERRILGTRGSDGRVHAPPVEYDPITHAALTELVEVAGTGTVLTWSWQPEPRTGQPLGHPFAWALIRLDGADTPMLHAVDGGTAAAMSTGMRVQARWAAAPVGHIRDIECFEPLGPTTATPPLPAATATPPGPPADAVTQVVTPIRLWYQHMVSPEESRYLRGLAQGRLLGQRCPACGKVYIPPRGACPTDGVPTTEEVELSDHGTVVTFAVVNVPHAGQRHKPPYVAAYVLLDGADIPMLHLILGCPADQVHMGMRVAAVWRPRELWGTTPENIESFQPTGEPDAPYESYARHL